MLRLRPLTLLGAAVCALTAAAPAHAAKEVVYDVTVEGTAHFTHSKHIPATPEAATDWTHETEVSATMRGHIRRVTFRDGLLYLDGAGDATTTVSATSKITLVGEDGTDTEECTGTTEGTGAATASLVQDPVAPLDGSEALFIRAADVLPATWACKGDPLGAQEGVLDIAPDAGDGALDAAFRLPRDVIGAGKIIQVVHGAPEHADQQCLAHDSRTVSCSGGWDGQVTFTKIAERTVTDAADDPKSLLAPLVPHTNGAPAPPASVDDLLAPLVLPKKASVDARGRTVSFTASCTSGCVGTATFAAAGASARAAAARPLATVRFRVRAGGARTIRVTLPARARRALKRSRRLTMRVALRSGRTVKRSALTLRLR